MKHKTTLTPRTDSETRTWEYGAFVHKDFAFQLERELTDKTNEAARLREALERAETAFREREADRASTTKGKERRIK